MLEKLKKASPGELQLWLWSAWIFGIGFGAYVSDYIRQYALIILIASLLVHLFAMYKIYSK